MTTMELIIKALIEVRDHIDDHELSADEAVVLLDAVVESLEVHNDAT